MILGHGTFKTDKDIVAEYFQFLHDARPSSSSCRIYLEAPGFMLSGIGKPIAEWTDDDIIDLCKDRAISTIYPRKLFLTFLIFRGYHRPTFRLLTDFPILLSQYYEQALVPYRQRLEEVQEQLGYSSFTTGQMLCLLVWLLAIVGKPLAQLDRADFDSFWDEYQGWYRSVHNEPNSNLFRLNRCLVQMGIISPKAKASLPHDRHFIQLRHGSIRQAVITHIQWYGVKYKPSSVISRRAGLMHFFLWFQEHYPHCSRLDDVTRSIVLEYCRYLKAKAEAGGFSPRYCRDLHMHVRRFFDFTINERLDTSPDRNPFAKGDIPWHPYPSPRYLSDCELRKVLLYCSNGDTLREQTIIITLLHTGIRVGELLALQVNDIVQIQGKWKLHIREGKGMKDRIIPLTSQCLSVLQTWQEHKWNSVNDHLFTWYGRPFTSNFFRSVVREVGQKLNIEGLTPHRFRHTFAVALLNYGIRESALQKLMGHKTLGMTLHYGRILDRTVEQSFNQAIERMEAGSLSWVPSFFTPEDYTLFTEGDALNWIRLPHGYCRRHHKLHCESDVKCLLCDRFCALPGDLPRLQEMHDRFLRLGMEVKANVVDSHIRLLSSEHEALPTSEAIDSTLLQESWPSYWMGRSFPDMTAQRAQRPCQKLD